MTGPEPATAATEAPTASGGLSWLDALKGPRPRPTPPAGTPLEPLAVAAGVTRYAATALAREVAAVAGAEEGTRNDALNASTFALAQLVAAGALDERTVRDEMTRAGVARGLSAREVAATVASAFRKAQPRDLAGVRELAAPDVVEVTAAELVTVGEHVDDAGQVWETFTGSTEAEAEAPRHTSWWAAWRATHVLPDSLSPIRPLTLPR